MKYEIEKYFTLLYKNLEKIIIGNLKQTKWMFKF